jgi:UPF0755 protein
MWYYMLRTLPIWLKASLIALLILLISIIHHIYAYVTPPSLLYIPDNNSSLTEALNDQGISFNLLDYRLLKRYHRPAEGWVRFDTQVKLSREELLQALLDKPRERTRRLVMYSGDSIQDFATRAGAQTNLLAAKIIQAYRDYSPYEEGGILAGFYQIPYRTTPTAIAYYMTHQSNERFQALSRQYTGDYDTETWRHILTIASIIQKETQNSPEMPLVSSVIHNRLAKEMKLQLDATLNYGTYSHTPITPERIKQDKSHYNTYLHLGLPPHPIGSVSTTALIAALNPAKSDYLYFMLADHGTHNFASTYKEHLAHIRWYKRQKEKLQISNKQ